MGIKTRKPRAVIRHEDIVAWVVKNRAADSKQVARHFGICQRAAQKHLKRIRTATE